MKKILKKNKPENILFCDMKFLTSKLAKINKRAFKNYNKGSLIKQGIYTAIP